MEDDDPPPPPPEESKLISEVTVELLEMENPLPSRGWDVDRFVELTRMEEMGARVRCCVCAGVMRDAMEAPCGHQACMVCFRQCLKAKGCPQCKAATTVQQLKEAIVRNVIPAYKVSCFNKKQNCTWVGPLKGEAIHLKECAGQQVKCAHCLETFPRAECDQHVTQCTVAVVACPLCQERMKYAALTIHQDTVCKQKPVSCTNGCGIMVVRKVLRQHLATECPSQSVNCPYKGLGCVVPVTRGDLSSHTQSAESLAVHNKLLLTELTSTTEQLHILVEKEKSQRRELEKMKERMDKQAPMLQLLRALPSVTRTMVILSDFTAKSQAYRTGSFWASNVFETPGGASWRVWVYPNGSAATCSEYVSVCLVAVNNRQPTINLKTKSSWSLLHPNITKEDDSTETYDKDNTWWGYDEFILRTEVENNSLEITLVLQILGVDSS